MSERILEEQIKSKRTEYLKTIAYFIATFLVSYGLGWIFHDKWFLGSTTLYAGFIQTYFLTKGKWFEEFAGMFETMFTAIVCGLSGLYGNAIFTVLIYLPLTIFSLVNWKKHDNDGEVALNKMTFKKSILVIVSVIVSTLVISYLLSLIPGQKFPLFDTITNIFDICAILLIALRYKEGWILWIIDNVVDLTMWAMMYIKGYSGNAIMMMIMSVIYMGLNIWGFLSFIKLRRGQEQSTLSNQG